MEKFDETVLFDPLVLILLAHKKDILPTVFTYQVLDKFLKPLCRDGFFKSQPVSLFTDLLLACLQGRGKGEVIRTRGIVRQDSNLEKFMERKHSAPDAVEVCLRLTQYLGDTFVKKSPADLSEKWGL